MKRVVFSIMILIFTSCAVVPPEIKLTGERTALENQIIGTFDEIESESWITASQRSTSMASSEELQAQQQTVLDAVQTRKFNADEIRELKEEQVIGENNRGFLEILGNEQYRTEPQYQQRVNNLVEHENQARRIIYQRAMAITLAEQDSVQAYSALADIRADESAAGTLIQQPDGSWAEKTKEPSSEK